MRFWTVLGNLDFGEEKGAAVPRRSQALIETGQCSRVGSEWTSKVCSHSTMARLTGPERRRKGRLKLPQTVRVRPSDTHGLDLDEILPTLNSSRDSIYFASKNEFYTEGMRVFVTYPYSDKPGSLNRESLGKVVRIDDLGHGRRGIAVEILMPVYIGGKETMK